MSKSLHKHYDRLDAEERFRLDLLAMARGDLQESERLVSSCPRLSYTMNDRGFGGRWHGAIEITLRIYIPLGEQLAKLHMVDAFREMVPFSQTLLSNIAFDAYFTGHRSGSYHAWNYAGKTSHPPTWLEGEDPEEIWEPDEDEQDPAMEREVAELEATVGTYGAFLPEVLDKLEHTCVSRAFSLWSGYAAFCRDSMGVSADKVAAVILEPVMDRIADMKVRVERLDIEADEALVQEMRESLAESWRLVEARDV
jgi:hypothetical protein